METSFRTPKPKRFSESAGVYDGQGIVAIGTEENFTDNWIVHDVSAPSGGYSCGGKTGRVYELVSGVYQQRAAVGFTTEDSGCM